MSLKYITYTNTASVEYTPQTNRLQYKIGYILDTNTRDKYFYVYTDTIEREPPSGIKDYEYVDTIYEYNTYNEAIERVRWIVNSINTHEPLFESKYIGYEIV